LIIFVLKGANTQNKCTFGFFCLILSVKKHHPSARRMMLQLLINHFGDIILPLGGEDAGTDVQTNPRPVLP
jgi:hypothetical protein